LIGSNLLLGEKIHHYCAAIKEKVLIQSTKVCFCCLFSPLGLAKITLCSYHKTYKTCELLYLIIILLADICVIGLVSSSPVRKVTLLFTGENLLIAVTSKSKQQTKTIFNFDS